MSYALKEDLANYLKTYGFQWLSGKQPRIEEHDTFFTVTTSNRGNFPIYDVTRQQDSLREHFNVELQISKTVDKNFIFKHHYKFVVRKDVLERFIKLEKLKNL